MSCHNNDCGCSPSGYPSANNECCTDVASYTRFAYSSAQSAYANAQNAEQSAEDAATTLANAVLKTGSTMTGPLIVSVNSSSDGLRVTQVGSGNAILVEDSANPDATPFVVDSIGEVGVGTTTPQRVFHSVGTIRFQTLGTYADNAAAVAGGLSVNDVYKTATGELRIVV